MEQRKDRIRPRKQNKTQTTGTQGTTEGKKTKAYITPMGCKARKKKRYREEHELDRQSSETDSIDRRRKRKEKKRKDGA